MFNYVGFQIKIKIRACIWDIPNAEVLRKHNSETDN